MAATSDEVFTNLRPLSILGGYLALGLTLPFLILSGVFNRLRHRRIPLRAQVRLAVFFCLAIASLTTTWYHMFRFFVRSYTDWASSDPVSVPSRIYGQNGVEIRGGQGSLYLGQWLKETQLFRQAWETVIIGSGRWWWSQQIFLFTTGWSVFLSRAGECSGLLQLEKCRILIPQGIKHQVRHLWIYMLLGQIVAISFAMNLSFVAIIASDRAQQTAQSQASKPSGEEQPQERRASPASKGFSFLSSTSTILTLASIYEVPSTVGTRWFLPMLLVPHFLLFVPILLPKLEGTQLWRDEIDLRTVFVVSAALFGQATVLALQDSRSGTDIFVAELWSHPAVTSVGWDVIFCWLSTGIWIILTLGQGHK